jgi:hypothetical protein
MRVGAVLITGWLVVGCGDDGGRASDSAATVEPSTGSQTGSEGTGTPTSTGSTSDGSATGTGEMSTSTTPMSSSGTTEEPTGEGPRWGESTGGESTSGTSTGEGVCDPNIVADTLAFTYVSQFDTGITDKVLQASYYNTVADEVMIMSFSGQARRFTVDGVALGDVFAVPMEALPQLDGATFDPVLERGLLINQSCVLVEAEPQTLAVLSVQQLGFGMSVCAGLALGLDGNLYIASYGTNEMVVLSRDGLTEVRRIAMGTIPLTGFDGLALIAGSENFLVMSTSPTTEAAIIDPFGGVVQPATALGQASPPMIGGMPMLPDAVLTICGNGHAWVCEAYNATCFDYAPDDGDKNACECILPG